MCSERSGRPWRFVIAIGGGLLFLFAVAAGLPYAMWLWSASYDLVIERVADVLDVAELVRECPFLVSQVVRARLGGHALDLLETTLARAELSAEQFDAIDWRLAKIESSFRLAPIVCAERAAMLTTMENLGSKEMGQILQSLVSLGPGDTSTTSVPNAEWKSWWWGSFFYRPRLVKQEEMMLRLASRIAGVIARPGSSGQREFEEVVEDTLRTRRGEPGPLQVLFPAFSAARDRVLPYRQRLIAARLGLRAARYRMEHRRLPERLKDVLDACLPAIPPGLLSGNELQYDVLPDGFAIRDAAAGKDKRSAGFAVRYEKATENERR